jgi:IS5 family transposase
LVREIECNLPPNSNYQNEIDLFKQVLAQKRNSKNKIYSLHEPYVCCISKGKEHKKYEFGNKASFVKTDTGVIVGALGFRNEYDGHTLEPVLKQVERLIEKTLSKAKVDRGYRGKKRIGKTEILIPSPPKKSMSYYKRKKISEAHKKRARIEPVIGHVKVDHRLKRNFYKGITGDNDNIMLAAAAFNFKRMMNKWKSSFCHFFKASLELVLKLFFQNIILKTTF